MIISNDEQRIRTWVEENQYIKEDHLYQDKGDVENLKDMEILLKIIDNLRLGCPFDKRECNLLPEAPCPVCGDNGIDPGVNCVKIRK